MIVRFAVEPAAVTMDDVPAHSRGAVLDRLIDRWQHLGVLVINGDKFADSELAPALNRLKDRPALWDRWQTALSNCRVASSTRSWRGFSAARTDEELKRLGECAGLACCCGERAHKLGVKADQHCSYREDLNLEVVRFDAADQAKCFRAAHDLAGKMIEIGDSTTELWAARFAGFADMSRTIALVDRFAGTKDSESCGVRRLLQGVDRATGVASVVNLYCEVTTEASEHNVEANVRESVATLSRGGVFEVVLYLVPKPDFQIESHGRYLRFERAVFELDYGIEVLAGKAVQHRSSCSLKVRQEGHRKLEGALQRKGRRIVIKPPARSR